MKVIHIGLGTIKEIGGHMNLGAFVAENAHKIILEVVCETLSTDFELLLYTCIVCTYVSLMFLLFDRGVAAKL